MEENYLDYLICNGRLSDKAIKTMVSDVKKFMSDRDKDDAYFTLLDWQKKENELVVLTMYANNEIILPQKFDTIFQLDKPDICIDVDFVITQAIINGWVPQNHVSKGHKHFCIISCKDKPAAIFNVVPLFDNSDYVQNDKQFVFCERKNYKKIKSTLLLNN